MIKLVLALILVSCQTSETPSLLDPHTSHALAGPEGDAPEVSETPAAPEAQEAQDAPKAQEAQDAPKAPEAKTEAAVPDQPTPSAPTLELSPSAPPLPPPYSPPPSPVVKASSLDLQEELLRLKMALDRADRENVEKEHAEPPPLHYGEVLLTVYNNLETLSNARFMAHEEAGKLTDRELAEHAQAAAFGHRPSVKPNPASELEEARMALAVLAEKFASEHGVSAEAMRIANHPPRASLKAIVDTARQAAQKVIEEEEAKLAQNTDLTSGTFYKVRDKKRLLGEEIGNRAFVAALKAILNWLLPSKAGFFWTLRYNKFADLLHHERSGMENTYQSTLNLPKSMSNNLYLAPFLPIIARARKMVTAQ